MDKKEELLIWRLEKQEYLKLMQKKYVRDADDYFMGKLGLSFDSPTRIPGNIRK